jgi:hypothetical protein
MQQHRVPPPCDDNTTRAHLRANIAGDGDPGHWYLHRVMSEGGGSAECAEPADADPVGRGVRH